MTRNFYSLPAPVFLTLVLLRRGLDLTGSQPCTTFDSLIACPKVAGRYTSSEAISSVIAYKEQATTHTAVHIHL
jgi:hypothetical protein